MTTKKQSIKQKRKGKKQREEMGGTAVPLEAASVPLDKLPDHETARPLRQAQLLQMQQQHGNTQVQRLLQQNTNKVQRYESPEHQDLGDAHLDELHDYLQTDEGQEWASQHGLPAGLSDAIEKDAMRRGQRFLKTASGLRLTNSHHVVSDSEVMLTFGDVIALMGDLYPTWQAIINAPVEDVKGLLHTMRQERYGQISTDEATQGYETHSRGNYLRLAQQNAAHFAPSNRIEWQELHQEAIAKAQQSGNNEELFAEALFMDAAANHFLTDAFAAGHLLKKPKLEAAILTYLQANPIQDSDPEMQFYISIVQFSGNLHHLVLKNVHDHLNVSGFEISNGQGMSWRTYGDASLDKEAAATTRHIAALAVFLSRQQIYKAKEGESTHPSEVLNLLPNEESVEQATQQAIQYIPQAANGVPALIISMAGTSRVVFGDFLGRWMEAHLSSLGMKNNTARNAGIDEQFKENVSRNIMIPDSSNDTLRVGPISFNISKLSDRTIPYKDLRIPNMNLTAPIPGLEGISGEIDINGNDLTVGIHIDVGKFLPDDWGFGPSLPHRLGDRE